MARLADLENRIEMVDAKCEAYKVTSGLGTAISDVAGGNGRAVNLKALLPEASDAGLHPFSLVNASDGATKIRVVYGTVGGIDPDGMSPGDVPNYVLTVSGATGYIYVIVTTDSDYAINDVSIDFAATVPDDDEATFTYYFPLGSFAIDTGAITGIAESVSGSQDFKWCGSALFALV